MRAVVRLATMVVVVGLVMSTAYMAGFGLYYYLAKGQPPTNVPSQFRIFWEAWNVIKGEYYGSIPSPQEMTHGAIQGMLHGLGDPHTVLVAPEPAKNEQANLQGNAGDVGLNIDIRDNLLTVVSPAPNSPADKAGIRSGDIVLKIDDRDLIQQPITAVEAAARLRGTTGTTVTLTTHRIGIDVPMTMTLTRETYSLPTVDSKMLPDIPYGYIKVTLETAETANEFAKALDTLKSQKMTGLVLDLRNNPGGLFPDPVLDMAGQFFKNSEVVVYEKYRDGSEKAYDAGSRRGATELPVAVLVNSGTASAAEILAGALKDNKRAVLIGEPTFGKGSVQEIKQLSDGSALHITIATWYTPNHTEIEGTGLQPDIAVPLTDDDIAKSIDPQLNRAIDYLRKGA